ncbi:MAG: protein kinase [Planctomycetota bacterium]
MQSIHQPTCLTSEQAKEFLQERLPEELEQELQEHIGHCPKCQRCLEETAATSDMWKEVGEVPSAESTDAGQLEMLWDDLKKKLLPSEDPRFCGRIGVYDVCALLGAGSTGVVLKAYESRLNRFVAIKVLSPSLASQGPARRRFEREGRAIAAVSHEHVIPILAVDEFAGIPYLVMQYIPGISLLRRIEDDGPLGTCEVVRIGLQVASGLAAAHSQGIVHRDVKPANVILEDTVDRAMVTDFGIARVMDERTMTQSGVISGTPQYMSPEQARGETVDPRSDLFSLGGLLYAACTARPPFRAETVFGIIHRVCETEPRAIRDINPEIPTWLADFIAKLMSKTPDDRFGSAKEVADLLAREIAHLQNPISYSEPERAWLVRRAPRGETLAPVESLTSKRIWIPLLAAGTLFAALALPSVMERTGLRSPLSTSDADKVDTTASTQPISQSESEATRADDSSSASGEVFGPLQLINAFASVLPDEQPVVEWSRDKKGGELAVTSTFSQRIGQGLEVPSGKPIQLRIDSGDIQIRQTELDHATFVVLKRMEAGSREEAEKIANYLEVSVADDDGLAIEMKLDEGFAMRQGAKRFQTLTVGLAVPVGVSLEVETNHGDIVCGSLVGSLSATTVLGDLRCGQIDGDLWARARGGRILATGGCTQNVDLMSTHGDVCVSGIQGTGRLRCSDGKIFVGENQGRISAHATGGEIVVTHLESETRAHVEDGAIRVDLRSKPNAQASLSAAAGNIFVSLPSDAKSTLIARGEEIERLPGELDPEASDEESQTIAHQLNGGGESIELVALNGRIAVDLRETAETRASLGGSGSDFVSLGGSGMHSDGVIAAVASIARTTGKPRPGAMVPIEINDGHNIDGYTLYLPQSYDENEDDYPVILYLQGGYGVGGPITGINDWGLPRLLRDETSLDNARNRLLLDRFIVVSPHIMRGGYDDHPEVLTRILDEVSEGYRSDPQRIYVTGLSRGAHASWNLPGKLPGVFAATVPIGGRPSMLETDVFESVATWVAHNQGDPTVKFEASDEMVDRIESETSVEFKRFERAIPDPEDLADARYIFTSPDLDRHDAWTELYCSEALYRWLLSQRRND